MQVEVYFEPMQVDLRDIENVTPKYAHLRRLENLPPLHPEVVKRVITPGRSFSHNITEYKVDDYAPKHLYVGSRSFRVSQLDETPESKLLEPYSTKISSWAIRSSTA